MVEWLYNGLQSRVHRFDSGPGLHLNAARVAELVDAADLKSAGHCGRAGSIPASGTMLLQGATSVSLAAYRAAYIDHVQ